MLNFANFIDENLEFYYYLKNASFFAHEIITRRLLDCIRDEKQYEYLHDLYYEFWEAVWLV